MYWSAVYSTKALFPLFIMEECYLSHIAVWLEMHSSVIESNEYKGIYISLFVCLFSYFYQNQVSAILVKVKFQ